jgi:tetratricopeptide (TPR) repeat protein
LVAALLLPALLGGCGSTKPAAPTAQVDETLRRETSAGQQAYTLEHPDEAAKRYRSALVRARARDDLPAMADLGYNIAVAELRAGAPDRALAAAREAREELERRGAQPFPALLLAEATALYRTSAIAEADATAARAQAGDDAEATARATFLRGVIADERNDAAALAAAAGALAPATQPPLQADAAELAARLALRRNDPRGAGDAAARAVGLRRDTLDYRGLARALSLQGDASQRAGDTAGAADLYLRAGRSAAAQGDADQARQWLQQAVALAPDSAAAADARGVMSTLMPDSPPQ